MAQLTDLRLHPRHLRSPGERLRVAPVAVRDLDVDHLDTCYVAAAASGVAARLDRGHLCLIARALAQGSAEVDGEDLESVPLLLAEVRRYGEAGVLVVRRRKAKIEEATAWLLLASSSSNARRALDVLSCSGALRRDFEQEYALDGLSLGKGTSGNVQQARSIRGGFAVAVKVMRKDFLYCSNILENEVSNLMLLQGHRNIVRFYGLFEFVDDDTRHRTDLYNLVMELCSGDLWSAVDVRAYSEAGSKASLHDILSGLHHVHSLGIVHRDVKPENIMLRPGGAAVLGDFGLACSFTNQEAMDKRVGSPGYCAPEVLRREAYDFKVDVWSVGAALYFMLTRRQAFKGDTAEVAMEKTLQGSVDFEHRRIRRTSPPCRGYIALLLAGDPEQRPDAAEAAKHPWLHGEMMWASEALLAPVEVKRRGQAFTPVCPAASPSPPKLTGNGKDFVVAQDSPSFRLSSELLRAREVPSTPRSARLERQWSRASLRSNQEGEQTAGDGPVLGRLPSTCSGWTVDESCDARFSSAGASSVAAREWSTRDFGSNVWPSKGGGSFCHSVTGSEPLEHAAPEPPRAGAIDIRRASVLKQLAPSKVFRFMPKLPNGLRLRRKCRVQPLE